MKARKFYTILVLLIMSCSKNDDLATPEIQSNNEPPLSFNLMEVADGATEVDVLPTLSWESAKNPKGSAVVYDLYLGKETNPTTLYQSGISETSFKIDERLHVISDYYWKVIAKDVDGQSSQSDINSFTTRNLKIPEQPEQTAGGLPEIISHTALSFDNALWVLGGFNLGGNGYDGVWKASKGIAWSEIGDDALMRRKYNHTSLVYDNKMWILAGHAMNEDDEQLITHDVWSSSNGSIWNNMTSYTDFFPARTSHSSVVHKDKIFILAGRDSDGVKNDIWQYNGSWTQVAVSSSIFSARGGHSSVVYDDKIWVIGGFDNSGRKNDVWYSSDGSNWTLATAKADFPPIAFHSTVVFGGKMWIIGLQGNTDRYWYSDNGVHWKSMQIPDELHGRYGQTATVHNEKLYLIGGIIDRMNEQLVDDVWILE